MIFKKKFTLTFGCQSFITKSTGIHGSPKKVHLYFLDFSMTKRFFPLWRLTASIMLLNESIFVCQLFITSFKSNTGIHGSPRKVHPYFWDISIMERFFSVWRLTSSILLFELWIEYQFHVKNIYFEEKDSRIYFDFTFTKKDIFPVPEQ